jgi:hypothetical protein
VSTFRHVLEHIDLRALPFNTYDVLDPSMVGVTTTFDGTFRTKNLRGMDAFRDGRSQLRGDIHKDPHVYRVFEGVRLLLPIDPKWILTTTSWGAFSAGHSSFAGACTIRSVDPQSKAIVATPLFIGIPRSPWDTLFTTASPK